MILHDLQTERLILKGISEEDIDFIFQQFSNDEVNRYLYDAEPTKTRQDAEDIVHMYTQQKEIKAYRWIITLKSDNTKIGTLGFHIWNRETSSCEIGYDMQPHYWGKGYGKEAVKAMLEYIGPTLKLQTVTACIYKDNAASLALAQSLGFTNSGEQKMFPFHGEEYWHNIYKRELPPMYIGYCGIQCHGCLIYKATNIKDPVERSCTQDMLAKKWSTQKEILEAKQIECDGCKSERLFENCRVCQIRLCAKNRAVTSCQRCEEYPCEKIDSLKKRVHLSEEMMFVF